MNHSNSKQTERLMYVAYYKSPNRGESRLSVMYLEAPKGLMPPPVIKMGDQSYHPTQLVEYAYTDSQKTIGKIFGLTQQQVSRLLRKATLNPEGAE